MRVATVRVEVQTPLANISDIMKHVNGQFAQAWNARHGKTGHATSVQFLRCHDQTT
jgi:hypothetical protein